MLTQTRPFNFTDATQKAGVFSIDPDQIEIIQPDIPSNAIAEAIHEGHRQRLGQSTDQQIYTILWYYRQDGPAEALSIEAVMHLLYSLDLMYASDQAALERLLLPLCLMLEPQINPNDSLATFSGFEPEATPDTDMLIDGAIEFRSLYERLSRQAKQALMKAFAQTLQRHFKTVIEAQERYLSFYVELSQLAAIEARTPITTE